MSSKLKKHEAKLSYTDLLEKQEEYCSVCESVGATMSCLIVLLYGIDMEYQRQLESRSLQVKLGPVVTRNSPPALFLPSISGIFLSALRLPEKTKARNKTRHPASAGSQHTVQVVQFKNRCSDLLSRLWNNRNINLT